MAKLIAPIGVLLAAAVWLLLFVIIGIGLGTSFIAAGGVLAAAVAASAMVAAGPLLDAPLSAPGLLLGAAAFVILRIVLSVPLWVDIVSGLGVMGLYAIADAAIRSIEGSSASEPSPGTTFAPSSTKRARNGHTPADRRQGVGAH